VAELESTKHSLDRATCRLILASGRQLSSKNGGRILEMAVTVAAETTGGRQLVRLRRRLLQARAPPLAVGLSICWPARWERRLQVPPAACSSSSRVRRSPVAPESWPMQDRKANQGSIGRQQAAMLSRCP
jgi:hypothetical protein